MKGFVKCIIFIFFPLINNLNAQVNVSDKCIKDDKNNKVECVKSSFSNYFSSIEGVDCYFDFDEGLQCAKISKRPYIVYFTAHNDVNSRKMESLLFSDNEILNTIKENYTLVKLVKDDKMRLPEFYQIKSAVSEDMIQVFGEKSIYYQTRLFSENIHPAFYIVDLQKKQLTSPIYYDSSVEDFKSFLRSGIERFKPLEDSYINEPNFVSRIHRNVDKLDYYTFLGSIKYLDFVNLYESIDWETEFVEELESERFNFSDIEVINKDRSFYLSISTGLHNGRDLQYIIGFGYHQVRIEQQVSRRIRIYGSKTNDQEKIINLIKLFFCEDITGLTKELGNLDFLIELNDLYQDN